MLEKSFGLLFYLKRPKNYQEGNMPIYLRITVNGIAKEVSTSREWDLSKWNPHAQRATGNKEDAKSLNAFLDTLQAKIYGARLQLLENNHCGSAGEYSKRKIGARKNVDGRF
jgi:hypothetical protein